MPDIRVEDEKGTVHVFPDGSTPEMISKAMGLNTSDPAYSEQSMAAHPPKAPTQRVSNMPPGLEGHEMLASPVLPIGAGLLTVPKFIGGLAGTVGGGYGGDQISDALHLSPNAKAYVHDAAAFFGGALGTGNGAQFEDFAPSMRNAFSGVKDFMGRTMREPGKVTLSPGGNIPNTVTKGPLKPIPRAIASVGKVFGGPQIADAVIPAHPEPIGATSRLGRVKVQEPPQPNPFDRMISSNDPNLPQYRTVGPAADSPTITSGQAATIELKNALSASSSDFPKPLRPLVGTPDEVRAYEQQMKILGAEASDAGTYHAARGSANKKVNLQQRMGNKFRK